MWVWNYSESSFRFCKRKNQNWFVVWYCLCNNNNNNNYSSFIIGEEHKFINGKIGSEFIAKPVKEEVWCGKQALIVNVKGKGHYLGESKYWLDNGDKLGKGFLIK